MAWKEWVREAEVEPSLYAADFARLGEQIETLMAAGVDGSFISTSATGTSSSRSRSGPSS